MIGQQVGHYRIIEKLGEGGMGVVYKAEDTSLKRIAALKFLPHHLTTNETEQARFIQEAQSASALNHPNVCTIYGLGTEGDQQFIAMEFVDGMTLRQKIGGRSLSVKDALGYALQIGDALAEAHAKGIVHRDVKAENIMVTSKNQIKVMDFGLAKLKGSLKLTRTSSTVGTLAYMAPEQIQGGEVDARSDIFSFGIVLFEMLTGHTPFRGEHDAAMMYSILNEHARSLSEFRDDVPPDLDRIIQRALEKDPTDRYQHIDDMVSEIRRMQKQTARIVRPDDTAGSGAQHATGFQPSAPPAGRTPVWRRRSVIMIAGAAAVIIVAAALVLFPRPTEPITSMAVLPFINVSGDSTVEYLSDGFTEGLINTLSKLPRMKMMSSRSVFRFKGKDVDPQKAAADLHVGAVLTGRILQQGDNLSISAELINARDNSHIWGNQYNRKATDLLAVQSAISRDIADQLRVSMTGDQEKNFEAPPTQNAEAYEHYLRGLYGLNLRNETGFAQAVLNFREAIGRDPSFARAYAGLAQTYILMGSYYILPVNKSIDSARTAIRNALEIDPSLGEAHTSLASINEWAWDWQGAEREYRKAIELSPNFVTAHQWFGEFLAFMGRFDEGLAESQKARELDPLAPITYTALALHLVYMHRYDDARKYCDRALEIDPHFVRGINTMSVIAMREGKHDEAVQQAERAVAESDSSLEYFANLGNIYALTGRRSDALKILTRIQQRSKKEYVSPAIFALVYIGLGDNDEAFNWLNKGFETHDPAMEYMKVDPAFDPIRDDPRFTELMKKIGLPI